LLTLSDWRKGLLAVLLVGVLQDVLRKLTPGVPSYFILWAMLVYVFVVLTVFLTRSFPEWRLLFLGDRRVRMAWIIFTVLIVIQLVHAFLRFGGIAVPAFGALFYLGPPLAMLVGAGFANGDWRIHQFLLTYVSIFTPVCLSVYLSPVFQDAWPVLREVGSFVGKELTIFQGYGVSLKSFSGLMRVGEIASWHAATAAMFLAILALNSPSTARRVFWSVLILLLIGAIILTGRRKMLMALSIFFVAQWVLMARFRRGMGRLSIMLLVIGTLASYTFTLLEPASPTVHYVERGTTVFGDADDRLSTSVMLMKSAFNRSGGIGLGAGAGSQGAQYAGVDQSTAVGGSAESGLGKLMVEIGIPGIVISLLLLFVVGHRVLKNLRWVGRMGEKYLVYQVSFSAFMFANMMTFMVATQVFGDLFILIILGTVGGFILRIDEQARRYVLRERRQVEAMRGKNESARAVGLSVPAESPLRSNSE
jgi:hypothetical protein